ncbi:MAG TPA: HD domain-containing phosphohydrolase [Opitutaceae bacterium]|nr:HD domain-containing phosphohydrolase [Opitutaceae bacterium]
MLPGMQGPASQSDANSAADPLRRLTELNDIGIALSQERDLDRLLEKILVAAMKITHADGGTLYRRHADSRDRLTFEIVRTDSLQLALGGTTGLKPGFAPIELYGLGGRENVSTVVAYAVLRDRTVAIEDAYRDASDFDFSGTKAFDQRTGYRSTSLLAVPMKDHQGEIIGVLQLINARDRTTGRVVPFHPTDQKLVESLASQAAVAITNRLLILQLERLFESLIKLINQAIDEKSPYTGGHCARVPIITMMIAEAANRTERGPLAGWHMSEQDRYELEIAALLHDCGKIATPVHVVDKATKLQTIFDRIELIETRFEIVKRDAEIRALRARAKAQSEEERVAIDEEFHHFITHAEDDRRFLRACNVGGETMKTADRDRVHAIAHRYQWRNAHGDKMEILTPDEVENLTIYSGTLNSAERRIINHHVEVSIKMLEALPWPRHLRRVPEYAGGHHERMDGKGYPRGLTRDQMSVQARIMGIADIFEALTAPDRPYKRGKTLAEALMILGQMKVNGHIDPDLFDLFIRERVFEQYAKAHMAPDLIDHVDVSLIPGYAGD